jgi:hypothetical protein
MVLLFEDDLVSNPSSFAISDRFVKYHPQPTVRNPPGHFHAYIIYLAAMQNLQDGKIKLATKKLFMLKHSVLMFYNKHFPKNPSFLANTSRILLVLETIMSTYHAWNADQSKFIAWDFAINQPETSGILPWNLVCRTEEHNLVALALLEIPKPKIQNHPEYYAFQTGQSVGDILWAEGEFLFEEWQDSENETSALSEEVCAQFAEGFAETYKWCPMLVVLLHDIDDDAEYIFDDYNSKEWKGFKTVLKHIFGPNFSLFFQTFSPPEYYEIKEF